MKKILLTALILSSISAPLGINTVYAYSDGKKNTPVEISATNEMASPYLLSRIEASTRSDSVYVYAVARNTFTLFTSVVPVHIYLYSSDKFTTDIAEMTLEAEAQTNDLDVNKEITCKAEHTEQKYWVAYCVFVTDKKTKTATSYPILYSVNGEVL